MHRCIISYSGGKDSTAMLLYLKQNYYPIDEVVYVRDPFPHGYRLMYRYFKYIEKRFDLKISKLNSQMLHYIDRWGKPKLPHPYCVRIKVKAMVDYLKEKYGPKNLTIYLGIRAAESNKRKAYEYNEYGMPYFWNERFGTDYLMEYPIYKMKNPLKYLEKNHVKINPQYEKHSLNRLSCKYCVKNYKLWEEKGI